MQKLLQDVNIGGNLQRLRVAHGLSQAQVAAKLQLMGRNMSRATYSKIETGARNIKISDLIALKALFAVDYAELFHGLTPPQP